MAKLDLNSALKGIHGKVDEWVYRRFGSRTIISPKAAAPTGEPTAAQTNAREQFALAAKYARAAYADPVKRAEYEARLTPEIRSATALMIADYLNPPTVDAIDLSSYQGQIGDPIKVRASDDFGVVSVTVKVRAADETVIEEGAAVLTGNEWVYPAATALAAGAAVTIEATATDRPGNIGTLRVARP